MKAFSRACASSAGCAAPPPAGAAAAMMDGQVPWRCLVPADAVAFIVGKGGANIRQISDTSGAEVAVSKESETPETLADKIVTISGLVEQKENACAQVLRKLRQMQAVHDHEPGMLVIIIPQTSAPVIIGARGAQIKGIMEQSGAEINVGREAIIGMNDQPICINGTVDQVISAASRLNGVLQDMVDRGKLTDRDFVSQPEGQKSGSCGNGFTPGFGGPGAGGAASFPSTGNSTSFGGSGGNPTSFGGPNGNPTSFGGPSGNQNSFGGPSGNPNSFGGCNGNPNSFGGQNGITSSFGPGPMGVMNGMNGMGGMHGMGGMGGMGGMCGMGPMGGMGSMGGMGGMGGMGMMGMGNSMMGMGMGGMMGNNERAFMQALQASDVNNAQLTLLIPQNLVQNILVPRGFMAEVAQRSGAKIDLGLESPAGMRQVSLSGTKIANAMASLYLQEKMIQFQQTG